MRPTFFLDLNVTARPAFEPRSGKPDAPHKGARKRSRLNLALQILEAFAPVAAALSAAVAGAVLAARQLLGLEKEWEERRDRKAARKRPRRAMKELSN
jgi:hypothetical protein